MVRRQAKSSFTGPEYSLDPRYVQVFSRWGTGLIAWQGYPDQLEQAWRPLRKTDQSTVVISVFTEADVGWEAGIGTDGKPIVVYPRVWKPATSWVKHIKPHLMPVKAVVLNPPVETGDGP